VPSTPAQPSSSPLYVFYQKAAGGSANTLLPKSPATTPVVPGHTHSHPGGTLAPLPTPRSPCPPWGGRTILPTCVSKNSKIGPLHLSSAKGSAIFHLRLRRLVSFATRAHIAFCWDRHVEQCLNECSRVFRPQAPPALVALLLLDLHMGRREGLARFQQVERAAIRFGAFAGVAFLWHRTSNLRVFVRARDHCSWASFHFFIANTSLQLGEGCW